MRQARKKKLLTIIAFGLFLIIVGGITWQQIQFYRTIKTLKSIDPHQIIIFRVYPKFGSPFGSPVEFKQPDPIIDNFFQSVTDLRSYWSNLSPVATDEHSWFLEIATEEIDVIQMSCSIPAKKNNTVIGELDSLALFQSQQLFEWYQKYSHKWLEDATVQE
jgi:hypothetical protein